MRAGGGVCLRASVCVCVSAHTLIFVFRFHFLVPCALYGAPPPLLAKYEGGLQEGNKKTEGNK